MTMDYPKYLSFWFMVSDGNFMKSCGKQGSSEGCTLNRSLIYDGVLPLIRIHVHGNQGVKVGAFPLAVTL